MKDIKFQFEKFMPRPKSNKVTLRDIANHMGMTPATISKALRDGNDISEETRKKVKEIACLTFKGRALNLNTLQARIS